MSEAMLEARLRDLGGRVAFPSVDVAAAVAARVSAAPAPRRAPVISLPRSRSMRRAVAAAMAAVLLLGAAAVAGRLGVPGLRIIFSPGPLPTTLPVGGNLHLGLATTLEDARTAVDFEIRVPEGQDLGPASVWVGTEPAGGRVSLVYEARPGLPRSVFTRAGLLITEFSASVDEGFIKKLTQSGTTVKFLFVNGSPGAWFSGAPHELVYVDENGVEFVDSARLAGNTLVWSDGGLTIRLECKCGLQKALAIGRSMR